ncbi:MAG TPA: universal stress protein [Streptosporangiaceae bacterium]|nr:universal stress protein [Streptosporangiaceae bacterium]
MGAVSGPNIVVGVSGTAGSRRALRWAAEEAQQRGATLRVVLAWERAYLATYSSASTHGDRTEQERAAQSLLAETLYCVFGAETPDHVVATVVEGVPERVLVRESGAADLLVLGSTSASERTQSSVGPVIRGCVHQACCPVMVIGPQSGSASAHPDDLLKTATAV